MINLPFLTNKNCNMKTSHESVDYYFCGGMPWAIYRGQIYGCNHYIICRGNITIYFCSTLSLTV